MSAFANPEPDTRPKEDPMITVYGQPGCGPCTFVQKKLDREHIDYDYVDISAEENRAKLAELQAAGFAKTPIVETPSERFAGMQPDRIEAAIAEARQAQSAQQPKAAVTRELN